MNWLNTHRIELAGASVTYGALLMALATLLVGFVAASKRTEAQDTHGGLHEVGLLD